MTHLWRQVIPPINAHNAHSAYLQREVPPRNIPTPPPPSTMASSSQTGSAKLRFEREHYEFIVEWLENPLNFQKWTGAGKTKVGGAHKTKVSVAAELADSLSRSRRIKKKIVLDGPRMKQRFVTRRPSSESASTSLWLLACLRACVAFARMLAAALAPTTSRYIHPSCLQT